MEADLARYYGIDIADYHRGRLTIRRLWALLRWLPVEAAVWEAQRKDAERAEADQKVRDVQDSLAMFD